jgi:uncharacterized protein with GYD domain
MNIAVLCEMCSTRTSLLDLAATGRAVHLWLERGVYHPSSTFPYNLPSTALHPGGFTMQTYVSLVKFTQHGLQSMKDKGIERAEAVKHNAQTLGGKLIQAYYCLGEYDVVAIWEFPDNKTAMKAAVLNASLGHIEITTMPAVDREEWKSLLQQTIGKK